MSFINGTNNVSVPNAVDIIRLCKKYIIKGGLERCEKALVKALNIANVFDVLEISVKCNMDTIKMRCKQLIILHSDDLFEDNHDVLNKYSLSTLISVVSIGELLSSESDLVELCIHWLIDKVRTRLTRTHIETHISSVLNHLHLKGLSERQLNALADKYGEDILSAMDIGTNEKRTAQYIRHTAITAVRRNTNNSSSNSFAIRENAPDNDNELLGLWTSELIVIGTLTIQPLRNEHGIVDDDIEVTIEIKEQPGRGKQRKSIQSNTMCVTFMRDGTELELDPPIIARPGHKIIVKVDGLPSEVQFYMENVVDRWTNDTTVLTFSGQSNSCIAGLTFNRV